MPTENPGQNNSPGTVVRRLELPARRPGRNSVESADAGLRLTPRMCSGFLWN